MRTFDPNWKPKLTRSRVFDFINIEREYQILKWGESEDKQQSIEGYLIILKKELDEAYDGWMKNREGRDSALAEIVQIAATAVACLEDHGIEGN